MKKKAILIVDLGAVMGGVEYYIETLSSMIRERGTLVSICVLPELAHRLRNKGVTVYLIPAFRWFRPLRFLLALVVLPFIIRSRAGADRVGQRLSRVISINTLSASRMSGYLRTPRPV